MAFPPTSEVEVVSGGDEVRPVTIPAALPGIGGGGQAGVKRTQLGRVQQRSCWQAMACATTGWGRGRGAPVVRVERTGVTTEKPGMSSQQQLPVIVASQVLLGERDSSSRAGPTTPDSWSVIDSGPWRRFG